MKEFDGYDEERELFEEIREVNSPVKSIIDRILEQVEVK
jgi:hypothetical protein